jgi:hypothetical protein
MIATLPFSRSIKASSLRAASSRIAILLDQLGMQRFTANLSFGFPKRLLSVAARPAHHQAPTRDR